MNSVLPVEVLILVVILLANSKTVYIQNKSAHQRLSECEAKIRKSAFVFNFCFAFYLFIYLFFVACS